MSNDSKISRIIEKYDTYLIQKYKKIPNNEFIEFLYKINDSKKFNPTNNSTIFEFISYYYYEYLNIDKLSYLQRNSSTNIIDKIDLINVFILRDDSYESTDEVFENLKNFNIDVFYIIKESDYMFLFNEFLKEDLLLIINNKISTNSIIIMDLDNLSTDSNFNNVFNLIINYDEGKPIYYNYVEKKLNQIIITPRLDLYSRNNKNAKLILGLESDLFLKLIFEGSKHSNKLKEILLNHLM